MVISSARHERATLQEVELLEPSFLGDSIRVNRSPAFRNHYLFGCGMPDPFASWVRRLSDGRCPAGML